MAMVKKTETISEDITKLVQQMRKKVNKTLSEDLFYCPNKGKKKYKV